MKKSFDKAIETFQKALSLDPSRLETHKDLGIIYWQRGEPEKALASLRKAFELGLKSAEVHCYLGLACEKTGAPDLAAKHFRSALALGPGEGLLALACSRLGQLQFRKGDLEGALRALHIAYRLEPMNAQTSLHLALAYDELNRPEEAVVWFNKTLALGSMTEATAEVHARLGLVYLALGLVEEAYEMGRKALAIDAETGLAHGLLGAIFLANGFTGQAAAHLAEQARLSPGEASYLHYLGLAQRHEAQASRENVDRQVELGTGKETPALLTALGTSCIALGRYEGAVQALEKAAELEMNNAAVQLHLARALSAKGASAAALACFQRYLDLSPHNSAADLLDLGCMQARLGSAEEAILSFERAIDLAGENCRLEPWNGASWQLLGKAYGRKRMYDRAAAIYRKLLILEPGNMSILLALAAACLKRGSYRESLETYRAAYRLTADRARTPLTLAECQLARGETDKALQTGLERLRAVPTCYKVHLTLGRAYLAKGLHQEAVSICQRILTLTPEEAEAHFCPAGSCFGSRSCYKQAWLFGQAQACLGSALMGLARWDGAIAALRKAVGHDPRDAGAWRLLGEAYGAKGIRQEAAECFRRAGALDPLEARKSRQQAARSDGEERDILIARLKKTLETSPDNFEACKALGDACGQEGLHDEAIYYLKNALKLRPADSEVLLRMGLSQEAKGEEEAAFGLYEKAVGLQPENPAICTAVAQRYLERRAYDKVLRCYSRLQGKELENAAIQTHLARSRQARGEYAAALVSYSWLAREGGREAADKAYRELALCSLELKDYGNMLQYAHEALLRDPNDVELHRRLGDHYYELGERDKAITHYQALQDLAPADPEILARLSAMYLHLSRKEQGKRQ